MEILDIRGFRLFLFATVEAHVIRQIESRAPTLLVVVIGSGILGEARGRYPWPCPSGDRHGSRAECRITLQTREFRTTVMGVSLTPSSRSAVNVGLVSGTTGSYVADRDRFKPDAAP